MNRIRFRQMLNEPAFHGDVHDILRSLSQWDVAVGVRRPTQRPGVRRYLADRLRLESSHAADETREERRHFFTYPGDFVERFTRGKYEYEDTDAHNRLAGTQLEWRLRIGHRDLVQRHRQFKTRDSGVAVLPRIRSGRHVMQS